MTSHVLRALIVGGLFSYGGCASPAAVPAAGNVRLEVAEELSSNTTYLTYGHQWTPAAALGGHIAEATSRSVIPAWANAVTAFIDANENGQYDALREPSGNCVHRDARWHCQIRVRHLTVHRVASVRLDTSVSSVVDDQLTVAAESYDADGRPDGDLQLCVQDGSTCAGSEPHPFVADATAVAVSPCALKAIPRRAGDPVTVEVRDADSSEVFSLPQPVDLAMVVTVRETPSTVILEASLGEPWTHAIAWIGDPRSDHMVWTTELDPEALVRRRRSLAVTVPLERMRSCAKCTMMLQVVQIDDKLDHRAISEARFIYREKERP